MDMAPSRAQMDQNSGHDQSGAEPKGQSGRLRGEGAVYQLNLLKEKTKARHYEAKTHQRETGTNPGEKRTLHGKVITKFGSGRHRGIIRRSRDPPCRSIIWALDYNFSQVRYKTFMYDVNDEPMATTAALWHGPASPLAQSSAYEVTLATTLDEVRACQRLRYEVFNAELGEGLDSSHALGLDHDRFDVICDHLLVREAASGAVVGTYRMQT